MVFVTNMARLKKPKYYQFPRYYQYDLGQSEPYDILVPYYPAYVRCSEEIEEDCESLRK